MIGYRYRALFCVCVFLLYVVVHKLYDFGMVCDVVILIWALEEVCWLLQLCLGWSFIVELLLALSLLQTVVQRKFPVWSADL